MLQHFSSMMLEMYELADQVAPDDYPAACLDLIGHAVRFDIAALGCGAMRERRRPSPPGRDIIPEAISSSFRLNLPAPVICSAARMQQFFDAARLRSYVQRHGVRQLLLIGSADPLYCPVRWLLLARHGHQPFSTGAAVYVAALWPHLLRCNGIQQRRYLAAKTAACARAGYALISAYDAVEAADEAFQCMARREWPTCGGRELPAAILARLRRDGRYDGRLARWTVEAGPAGALLCSVLERLPVDLLTHAEAVAAQHYAQGRTHGEIAALLGVSSNTVRTHLAHVYSKLDIHRKSELPAQLR